MKFKNFFHLFNLFFLIINFVVGTATAEVRQDLIKGIQKIVDQDRETYQFPGLQLSVFFPGESVPHDFVSGNIKLNDTRLVNANNLFQIGSETKSFTSAAILLLESHGLLSIEDPVDKWLPQLPDQWKNITIKQLLNHTSGIFNYTQSEEWFEIALKNQFLKQWSAEEIIDSIKNKPNYFTPGSGYHYSNTNYILAGMIIERVTGKSVNDVFNSSLFFPLILSNTYYVPTFFSENILNQMAHGYSKSGLFPDEPKDITYFNHSYAQTAGSIISTTHDTAIWLQKLLKGSFLPNKQMNELTSLVDEADGHPIPTPDKNSGYGLGIGYGPLLGEQAWGHSGGTFGYNTMMVWLKCRDIVVAAAVNDERDESYSSFDVVVDVISFIQKSDPSKQCQVDKISHFDKNKSNQLWLDKFRSHE